MKLQEIIHESVSTKLRIEVAEILSESIIDYFGETLTKLKNLHPEEAFSDQNPLKVSIENIAKMITALKIISNKDYREVITKDDVGINPNSAREVFNLLDSIKKDGVQDKSVDKIFRSLADLAPSVYRREIDSLKDLKNSDDAKREQAIQKLEAFMLKSSQFFQRLKTSAKPT